MRLTKLPLRVYIALRYYLEYFCIMFSCPFSNTHWAHAVSGFQVILRTMSNLGLFFWGSIKIFFKWKAFKLCQGGRLSLGARRHWWYAELQWKTFMDWCNRALSEPCSWVIKLPWVTDPTEESGINLAFLLEKKQLHHHVETDKCLFFHHDLCVHAALHFLTSIDHQVTVMVCWSVAAACWVFFFSFVCVSQGFYAAHTKDECHASYFLLITSVHLEAFSSWLMLRQKKWNTFSYFLSLWEWQNRYSFWKGLVLPFGTL